MQFPSHDGRAFAALLVALSWVASGCFDATKPDAAETVAVAQFETSTVAVDTVASPDLPALEVASKPDGTALECPGGPGCACVAHTECRTGLCLDDPNNATGKACARKCVDVCPDGYACAPVAGSGGDISTICVPKLGHLCDPCAISKDCEALGLKDSACVDEGPLGRFCGIACGADADCPKTYSCKEVTTAEGGKLKQCVFAVEGGSAPFGQCTCSTLAVQKKLATACYIPIKDAAGKESGKCVGSRACQAEGLSACTALAASAELCDGKDNDCDGATDEAACDDTNPCTADVCDPAASGDKCVHTSQTGVACDGDNSVCTEGDSC